MVRLELRTSWMSFSLSNPRLRDVVANPKVNGLAVIAGRGDRDPASEPSTEETATGRSGDPRL